MDILFIVLTIIVLGVQICWLSRDRWFKRQPQANTTMPYDVCWRFINAVLDEPLLLLEGDSKLLAWNHYAERMFGLVELQQQDLQSLIPELDTINLRLNPKLPQQPKFWFDCPLKGRCQFRLSVFILQETPQVIWGLRFIRENPLQHHVEDERALTAINLSLLKSNLAAVIVIDHQDKIVELNPCAENLFGFAREQILGQSMSENIMPLKFRARHLEGIQRFIQTGTSSLLQKRIVVPAKSAKGDEFPIELEVTPVKIEGQWFFTSIIHDYSDKQRVDEQMQKMLLEQTKASESKSKFLNSMSHEIRTPLHAILGLVECIEQTPLNDLQLKYLDQMRLAGKNLLNMVNDVLELGRVEAHAREIVLGFFSPREVVIEHLSIFLQWAQEKGLDFYLQEDRQLPRKIYTDVSIVRQIISNLIANACKYTEQGSITCRHWFEHAAAAKDGVWHIEISDTGPGLTPQQISTVFDEYVRHEQSPDSGTGLGLMISKQLAALIDANLTVKSVPGQGCKFTLSVPCKNVVSKPSRIKENRMTAYLLGESAAWLACLQSQLEALAVTTIPCSIHDLVNLSSESVVIVDQQDENSKNIYNIAQLSQLYGCRFVSTVKEPEVNWQKSHRHYSVVCQPYYQVELLLALRTVNRNLPMRFFRFSQPIQHQQLINIERTHAFKVLVVDDSEVNRLTIRTFLELEGIRVTEAENGKEAIACLGTAQFDLILMDLRMPVLAGMDATRIIRAESLAPEVPIIALTAHVQQEERDLCYASGMQDFLTKPISKAMLLKRVQYWLEKKNIESFAPLNELVSKISGFPVFEQSVVERFRVELTSEKYHMLVDIFVNEADKQITRALDFLTKHDLEQVGILVHALKSSAMTFGAVRLSKAAEFAEDACREHQEHLVEQWCNQLPAVYLLTRSELKR